MYKPKSNFLALKFDLPRVGVEVESTSSDQSAMDHDRLMIQGASVVQFAKTTFVFVAIYISGPGRNVLYHKQGSNEVYRDLRTFTFTDLGDHIAFALELYNLCSALADESDNGDTGTKVKKLTTGVKIIERNMWSLYNVLASSGIQVIGAPSHSRSGSTARASSLIPAPQQHAALPRMARLSSFVSYQRGKHGHRGRPQFTFRKLRRKVAIDTLEPEIEVVLLDTVYCYAVLGNPKETAAHVPEPTGTGKKQRKKAKHRSANEAHHVDAVLSLVEPCHADARHGTLPDSAVLLSGSYDRTVRVFDARAPDVSVGAVVGADVEVIRWDPWDNHGFYVSLENGMVVNFDAHTLPSDIDQPSPAHFTIDGAAQIWNVQEHEDGTKRQVSLVAGRDLGLGEVFSAVWSPDGPLILAAAGSKAKLQIWDVGANFGAQGI
ncbi:hypothetical protein EDB87DRAFT_1681134 [Lactarius vividus]|nr:hypothetical protein EDB87DRAFT_1681134 [Lactarius vividus]